jgi:hypothetical protein
MLTIGHIATSFLISQIPVVWGSPLTRPEIILVTLSGYVLDLDLFIAKFNLKNEASHHLLPTHTPLFVLILSIIGFVGLNNYFSQLALMLSSISMFVHLILDDIGYWFCKFGWQKESKTPQIFWFYPFDKRRNNYMKDKILIDSNFKAIKNYF